jgi:hypothetical protein
MNQTWSCNAARIVSGSMTKKPFKFEYTHEELEIRFSLALTKLVFNFNYLDVNLGFSIRLMENPGNAEASHPKLSRTTTEQKIDLWLSLLKEAKWTKSPLNLKELEDWANRATKSRHIRNRLVHGYWRLLIMRPEKPVSLSIPPWWIEKADDEVSKDMTLEEFESLADEMESMFKKFCKIRNDTGERGCLYLLYSGNITFVLSILKTVSAAGQNTPHYQQIVDSL